MRLELKSILLLCITTSSSILSASGQLGYPTASPTPAPTSSQEEAIQQLNSSVQTITPQVALVSNIFSTDVNEEIPDQEVLAATVKFEWDRLLNTTSSEAAPFVICSQGGRAGVVAMLSHVQQQTQAPLPLYASSNLTCYIVQSYAADIINQTVHHPDIKYSSPVLSQLKLSKGLFTKAYEGQLLLDDEVCNAGLRVVLAPGVGDVKQNLFQLIRIIKGNLVRGKYLGTVSNGFIWADGSSGSGEKHKPRNARNSMMTASAQKRLRSKALSTEREGEQDHQADRDHGGRGASTTANNNNTLPERGKKWCEKLDPVLNGSVPCHWSALLLTAQPPYIRIDGYCSLSQDPEKASACLVTLLAYLSTLTSVLYIEPFPVFRSFNVYAGGITQSGAIDSFPMWDVGLNGTGQVIQVADTGLDMGSCYFTDTTGNVATTTYSAAAFDSTRRKVVQYVVWADSNDVASGHGTHVSGTIAGKCDANNADAVALNAEYQGIAVSLLGTRVLDFNDDD